MHIQNKSLNKKNQIHALETANSILKDELNSMKADNTFLITMAKQDKQTTKDLQQQIEKLNEEHRLENERKAVRQEEEPSNGYLTLKNSFNEIEKRCVKHQKSEIEVKKQLTVYKDFVTDLQHKTQELTERLLIGAEEYKILYRKYAALERMIVRANHQSSSLPKTNPTTLFNETGLNEEALVTLLRNSYELQQQDQQQKVRVEEEDDEEEEEEEEEKTTTKTATAQTSVANEEIRECPMCYWELPKHLTLEK